MHPSRQQLHLLVCPSSHKYTLLRYRYIVAKLLKHLLSTSSVYFFSFEKDVRRSSDFIKEDVKTDGKTKHI